MIKSIVVSLALALFFCGCSVGPDYVKPEARQLEHWLEEKDPVVEHEAADVDRWWTLFGDAALDTLIQRAYEQNLSLQIAAIRILEARAQLGIALGGLYPQSQSLGAGWTANSLSENTANSNPGMDFNYGDLNAGFDAAWELDFWGKFRRAVEADVGGLEASIANYDDVLVSLTAEVANTYVQIRTLEAQLEIAEENVKIQEQSLNITEVRFKEGDVTELDVQQAKALLRDTQASIPRLKASLRQAENGLSILLGVLPGELGDLLNTQTKSIPKAPAKIEVGIPAELLRRRPDIRLAERQLAAQSALIGVAKADLYPHFSLFGSIGLRTSDAAMVAAGSPDGSYGDLWNSDSIEFFGGPVIGWDVLNYGRIKNRVRVQDARFQQLAVNYQDTVLRAAKEVEDAMVAFLRTKAEAEFLAESVTAAMRSVKLSMIQYREGLVDFQRVLDTQRFQAQQQDALTRVNGAVAGNLIAMYKALGGGWQMHDRKDLISAQNRKQMQERTDWGRLVSEEELQSLSAEEAGKQSFWPDW